MAFQLLFRAGRDDQIGNLRRQETAQSAHPLNLAHLLHDPLFELLVELRYFQRAHLQLLRSLAQFVQKPGVLDRDHSLGGKIGDQLNLLACKWPHLLAIDTNRANQFALLEHWHVEKTSHAAEISCRDAKRFAVGVSLLGTCIDDMDSLLIVGDTAQASPWTSADRSSIQIFVVFGRHAESRDRCVSAIIKAEQYPDFGSANPCRALQDCPKNWLQFARRRTDNLQDLESGLLLLQRLAQVGRPLPQLSN